MRLVPDAAIDDRELRQHRIALDGACTYKTLSAIHDDTSPAGLISSVHAAVTKVATGVLENERAALKSAERTYRDLKGQKEARGEFPHRVRLAKLKEDSTKLKRAIERDREKHKRELKTAAGKKQKKRHAQL